MKSIPPKVFLGLDCPLICEHKTAPLWTDPNGTLHNHDGYELFLFLDGCVTFFSEHGGFSLEPGSLLLIPPHMFHRAEQKKNGLLRPFCYQRKGRAYEGTQHGCEQPCLLLFP